MKSHVAALAGLVLGLAAFLTVVATAAPADATISFCKTAKNSPCIGPINGCTLSLGTGQYAFAENGDSVVDGTGVKYTCQNGKWVKAASLRVRELQMGSLLGRGLLVQGAPADDVCDVNQVFCPPIP